MKTTGPFTNEEGCGMPCRGTALSDLLERQTGVGTRLIRRQVV